MNVRQEVFPADSVQFPGQILGVVAAESEVAGRAGAAAVAVQLQPLPALLTLQQAAAAQSKHGEQRQLIRQAVNCFVITTFILQINSGDRMVAHEVAVW